MCSMPYVKILILSPPRSGSSLLTRLIASSSYRYNLVDNDNNAFGAHEFNKQGYFEDVFFTLLNDQLIRLYYGMEYSFLFPPSLKQFLQVTTLRKDKYPNGFSYDVDVINGEKWERCYSKHGIATKDRIIEAMRRVADSVEKAEYNLVLKDPRLSLVMPLYQFSNIKIIWIQRNPDDVRKSMQRHYGPRMFTTKCIPGTPYVSNHFNHKVGPMDFQTYYKRYHQITRYCLKDIEHLVVRFEELIKLQHINKLEDFIGAKIDKTIIDPLSITHSPEP
ncbi:MAG: hypothetical protein UY09_C0022G0007 [Parcubacteria group bacterium GW2011_GWA2_47_8]|nr:MAG: hypothetical protein UY09_C0022G0007 [Parcubacteria group bacterium GW2011_GWA2_47_8]